MRGFLIVAAMFGLLAGVGCRAEVKYESKPVEKKEAEWRLLPPKVIVVPFRRLSPCVLTQPVENQEKAKSTEDFTELPAPKETLPEQLPPIARDPAPPRQGTRVEIVVPVGHTTATQLLGYVPGHVAASYSPLAMYAEEFGIKYRMFDESDPSRQAVMMLHKLDEAARSALLSKDAVAQAVQFADNKERQPVEAIAPQKDAGDISGVYSVRGKESKGDYHGVAVIEKHGEHYIIRYMVGAGITLGAGIHKGDTLSVGWKSLAEGEAVPFGVTIYRIEKNRLVGRWAGMPTKGTVQDEELRLIDTLPKDE